MIHHQSLFRQEAIEFERQQRQWGKVILLQPLSIKLTVWFIAVAVALVMTVLSLEQYAQKETVVGYLTSTAGAVKVFAPREGTIKTIYVEEGEHIQEGQPLMTIVTDKITDEGKDVDAVVLGFLTQQRAFLIQHIADEEARIASEQQRLTTQIRGLETEISQLEAQIAIQNKRLQISESLVSAGARLSANSNMSEYEYKNRLERYLDKQQTLSSLNQQQTQRQIQMSDSRSLLTQLPVVMAEQIQVFRNKLSETEQRIAEISGRRAYTIRAPIAGQVSTLQAVIGQDADPRRPQLSILPVESVLQAELFVPTRAIGFVRSGQEVRILYEAFPYQQFGTYGGRITKVTRTILTSSDISAPITLKEAAYKVTVALDRQDIDAYGERVPLQEDMLLKADIILDKRSLLKWFLDPLFSARV
jgi:multidrug efflux pump subunit AcrA (membrane-fusion protein)